MLLKFPLRQALVTLMLMTPAVAASPDVQRGRAYASKHCGGCHSIDLKSRSRLKAAPPFRNLHLRYPIETLAESLAEGISTGHPAMPDAELSPDRIHDLLSFLKTLE
jgi:mono/diheme cytochrome c family protein